ncbi:hypothetical protein QJS04_geneDACA003995 [Acorus gramineus]|uniref:AAA+ ATPase domain-containing protein n=1 Tax=Acorus gramineus TaxID=55184 RepID=A0AAV9BGJ6_ACOGR|nr:hypothetical protein QJS04_geneDACA003995 [Acorus gramineus]
MKELWTSLASMMGVFAFFQSLLTVAFPPELRLALSRLLRRLRTVLSTHCYFDIVEIDGVSTNELYNAVQLYLSSSAAASSSSGGRLSLSRPLNSSSFTFSLSNADSLVDHSFRGFTAHWDHIVTQRPQNSFSWRPVPDEKRGFTLKIKKKDKPLMLEPYLDHIMDRASDIRRRNQDRLLFTNSKGGSLDPRGHPWESVPFKHPSTFDTLALDPDRKRAIMDDLRDFVEGKSFYQRTGRAWKRGYLLYGPPGTGKSSMIAAMANYLGYDIYDLELTEVSTNSELRKLLMKTTSKSIIVIEDIDCSINLSNRVDHPPPPKRRHLLGGESELRGGDDNARSLTLSGLLNFTDGLWSCCGSERIFVFTTNHVEKIDPALLRCGRMDMHIHMSYCSYPAMKILMKNYLGFEDGDFELDDGLFAELERLIGEVEMTPADVSEVLIKRRRLGKRRAVEEVVEALKGRRKGGAMWEENARREEEEEEQEKRALESPKNGESVEAAEGKIECGGGGEVREEKKGE